MEKLIIILGLLIIILVDACNRELSRSPVEVESTELKSNQAELLKLELEQNGIIYPTRINGIRISFLNLLPYQTQEMRIKTIEVSPKASSDKKTGATLQVRKSPITIKVRAENELTQKVYTLDLKVNQKKYTFTTDANFIRLNDKVFYIKGIVYVPCYPGVLPWIIERAVSLPPNLKKRIAKDLANIKAVGANTIRFWGAPKYCYQALQERGDLYFLQTIWIDSEYPDFQNPAFKNKLKTYIREVVDRIYSVFKDNNPPLIAYIVGNELSRASLELTNAAHPDIISYKGNYITALNINASQAFIAEMADYVKTYEFETYGNLSLVSYANDIRTPGLIDVPFLDFRSHNAYSYAVPYFKPTTQLGSYSKTIFQGWIEEIKSKYPHVPLLITETGLSIAPNVAHIGAPNYGYGGNTEVEQADGLVQNIKDLKSAKLPIAGVCIHEYLDAWWKFEQINTQEPNRPEEWFGIVAFKKVGDWYETEFRKSYDQLKTVWK